MAYLLRSANIDLWTIATESGTSTNPYGIGSFGNDWVNATRYTGYYTTDWNRKKQQPQTTGEAYGWGMIDDNMAYSIGGDNGQGEWFEVNSNRVESLFARRQTLENGSGSTPMFALIPSDSLGPDGTQGGMAVDGGDSEGKTFTAFYSRSYEPTLFDADSVSSPKWVNPWEDGFGEDDWKEWGYRPGAMNPENEIGDPMRTEEGPPFTTKHHALQINIPAGSTTGSLVLRALDKILPNNISDSVAMNCQVIHVKPTFDVATGIVESTTENVKITWRQQIIMDGNLDVDNWENNTPPANMNINSNALSSPNGYLYEEYYAVREDQTTIQNYTTMTGSNAKDAMRQMLDDPVLGSEGTTWHRLSFPHYQPAALFLNQRENFEWGGDNINNPDGGDDWYGGLQPSLLNYLLMNKVGQSNNMPFSQDLWQLFGTNGPTLANWWLKLHLAIGVSGSGNYSLEEPQRRHMLGNAQVWIYFTQQKKFFQKMGDGEIYFGSSRKNQPSDSRNGFKYYYGLDTIKSNCTKVGNPYQESDDGRRGDATNNFYQWNNDSMQKIGPSSELSLKQAELDGAITPDGGTQGMTNQNTGTAGFGHDGAGTGCKLGSPESATLNSEVRMSHWHGYNSTVLCSELYHQGILSEDLYKADCEVTSKKYSNTLMYAGYLLFAYWPLWLLRNKKTFAKKYMHHIIIDWAEYLAYQNGTLKRENKIGKSILYFGIIFLPLIGLLSKITNSDIYNKAISTICFVISFPPLLGYSILVKKLKEIKLWG